MKQQRIRRHRMVLLFAAGALAVGLARAGATSPPPLPPPPPDVPPAPAVSPTNRAEFQPIRPLIPRSSITSNPTLYQRNQQVIPVRPLGDRVPRAIPPANAPKPVMAPFPLQFDEEIKEVHAAEGATQQVLTYRLTNSLPEAVTIDQVRGSCGCTVARLPSVPWTIPANGTGQFDVAVDLRGKRGLLHKMVYVFTAHGYKALQLKVHIPDPTANLDGSRVANIQIAAADRQAVFRNDCATCHAEPAQGKQGKDLYLAVCGICHEAEHRASMVPDLATVTTVTSAEHWRFWVSFGKPGTLMPAFSSGQGGPLSEAQIDSLVEYLIQRYPPPSATAVAR